MVTTAKGIEQTTRESDIRAGVVRESAHKAVKQASTGGVVKTVPSRYDSNIKV